MHRQSKNDPSPNDASGLVSDETVAAFKGLDTAAKMPGLSIKRS